MANVFENIVADTIQATDAHLGYLIVNGKARFVQPIYADIENATDINQVTTQTLNNQDYVILTNGTSLRKVRVSDFVNGIVSSVLGQISSAFDSAENVGY